MFDRHHNKRSLYGSKSTKRRYLLLFLHQKRARYPYYTEKVAEILGCTKDDVEPFIHLSILAINNYMIFAERALFDSQIEYVKKELMKLAERYVIYKQ